jgi:hypothetical protein
MIDSNWENSPRTEFATNCKPITPGMNRKQETADKTAG